MLPAETDTADVADWRKYSHRFLSCPPSSFVLCVHTPTVVSLYLFPLLSLRTRRGTFSLFAEIGMSIPRPLTPEVWDALAFIVDMITEVSSPTSHWGFKHFIQAWIKILDLGQCNVKYLPSLSIVPLLLSPHYMYLSLCDSGECFSCVGCLRLHFESNSSSACKWVMERDRGRWTWHAVAVPATLSQGRRGHGASAGVPDSAAQSLSQLYTTTFITFKICWALMDYRKLCV